MAKKTYPNEPLVYWFRFSHILDSPPNNVGDVSWAYDGREVQLGHATRVASPLLPCAKSEAHLQVYSSAFVVLLVTHGIFFAALLAKLGEDNIDFLKKL